MDLYKVELTTQTDAAIPGTMRCVVEGTDAYDAIKKARHGAGYSYQHGGQRVEAVKASEPNAATEEMKNFVYGGQW